MTTLTLATKEVLEHLLKKERKTTQKIKPERNTNTKYPAYYFNYFKYEFIGFP